MINIRKYLNNQNWNIGFTETTPDKLIQSGKLPNIHWLKHQYKDRFFADPFILNADENIVEVLAEEYEFKANSKGIIVKLIVDRNSAKLINRIELLKLETHLSYPFIERCEEKVYIYPENSENGKLTRYIYDGSNNKLIFDAVVSNYPLTDATIIENKGNKYLFSTIAPESLENAYLFLSNNPKGIFEPCHKAPVVTGRYSSRMGGSFFETKGKTYRPAQDCTDGYGKALTIYEVESFSPIYTEKPLFRLEASSWRYNLGLHTLNFHRESGLAVIDSYGYLYPVLGRFLMAIYNLKSFINGK